jgi:hypothetical protein
MGEGLCNLVDIGDLGPAIGLLVASWLNSILRLDRECRGPPINEQTKPDPQSPPTKAYRADIYLVDLKCHAFPGICMIEFLSATPLRGT